MMLLNGNAETVYDARSGLDRDIALGALVNRWTQRVRRGAVLRGNDTLDVEVRFV